MRAHNARGESLWTAGFNHLTDRTDDELLRLRGWKSTGQLEIGNAAAFLSKSVQILRHPAKEVDWRNLSVFKNFKDQGDCGSCWAVATVNMLEAHNEIRTGKAKQLSTQQIVNCVQNPKECGGQGGCRGATVELAMSWVMDNGLASEDDVPYTASDGTCNVEATSLLERGLRGVGVAQKHGSQDSLGLQSWTTLPSNRAKPLMAAVMDGPVAISVGADGWFMYDAGIFNSCSKDAIIDHAVVLVGYGAEGSNNYWTIHNSWGLFWGEKGHIRLLRHGTTEEDDAYCGIDRKPEDGIACKPYPKQVEVCGMCGMLYDSVAPKYS
jgi:cathepsin L